ncbi:MAG: hypothetical protein ABI619_12645, partial [Betaproteobacteria bacterium]
MSWHISVALFIIVLVLESTMLIPAGLQFQRTQAERLAERAQSQIEPLLKLGAADMAAVKRELEGLIGGPANIESIAVYRQDDPLALTVGSAPPPMRPEGLEQRAQSGPIAGHQNLESRVDVAWMSRSTGTPVVVARIDASGVRSGLISHLLRIGALMALIALAAMVAAKLVLDRWVLHAVTRLHSSALRAAAEPPRATDFVVPTGRGDEVGKLIAA